MNPKVTGYDKLAAIQLVPENSIMTHFQELTCVFRGIEVLSNEETMRLYSGTVPTDLQWDVLGNQQAICTFEDFCKELATLESISNRLGSSNQFQSLGMKK